MAETSVTAAVPDPADLAESMVPVACDLACLVRDQDPEAIAGFLDRYTSPEDRETRALLVVLAAMMPLETPVGDLLSWVPADGPVPVLAPCGSYAAFRRHERAGEPVDRMCRAAAREYWNGRNRTRGGKEAAGAAA